MFLAIRRNDASTHFIFAAVAGWGTTEFGGMKSDTLRKVMLSVISYRDCRRSYPNLSHGQLCTYGRGKDACQVTLFSGNSTTHTIYIHIPLVLVTVIRVNHSLTVAVPCFGRIPRRSGRFSWVSSVTDLLAVTMFRRSTRASALTLIGSWM